MGDLTIKDKSNVSVKDPLDISKLRRNLGLTAVTKNFYQTDLQLLLMFDITASMYKYFNLVQEKLIEIISCINHDVPGAQFAVFAYRNHGDEKKHGKIYYTTNLTKDAEEIKKFMQSVIKGGGGSDALTCMEDCLREANLLAWEHLCPKAITIIGDMPPHGVLDLISDCPREIDYKIEVENIKKKKIPIYPVFCGTENKVRGFYRWLAEETNGRFLEIDQVDILSEILVGISMKRTGNLDKYLLRLQKAKKLNPKIEKVLRLLE